VRECADKQVQAEADRQAHKTKVRETLRRRQLQENELDITGRKRETIAD
jgi:hypothetical protein